MSVLSVRNLLNSRTRVLLLRYYQTFWNRAHDWLWTKNAIPAFDYLLFTFGFFMQEKDFDFWLNNIL